MDLQTAVDLVVGGLTLGGLYALIAFTLSMALATTHVMNVAHGSLMVLGAAAATWLLTHRALELPIAIGLLLAAALGVGWLFEAGLVRPLLSRPADTILITSIVVTFGLALAIQTLLGFYWARLVAPEPTFSVNVPLGRVDIGAITLPGRRLATLAFAAAAIALFHLFLRRTQLGRAARAMAQDYEGALIVGIDPRAVSRAIFTLGTAFTALAGAFYVWIVPLNPFEGIWLTLVALIVVVVGGVGRLVGALAGGVLLGLAQVLTGFFAAPQWSPPVFLALLFLILMYRPEGLLGARS